MAKSMGERIIPGDFKSRDEYVLYLRHLFAYEFAKGIINENNKVLEVGSGEGYGTNLLSKKVSEITGLDVSDVIIEHANNRYGRKNCIFILFDGNIIPYADNTFDAVISFQVIEHVPNDTNYLKEIYRVLKKEGIYIVTTPNRIHRLRPGQKPWNKFHLREYYPFEFEKLLKSHFSEVTVFGIRGNDEIQRLEIERVGQSFLKYIFSILKNSLPESMKNIIKKVLYNFKKVDEQEKVENGKFLNKYNLSDYYVIEEDIDISLDLLALCKK